ncbi:cordon-bleu protein-like 1b isoform X2 [Cheilinus undulatus]|uniref:cordon-bleu protein-like 1b isoform X2 n=1 Tax=Cheilinus undulatus TaxID=241271 RepID=UPI001BD301A0|nr:cordon-bleu protein-like 1b isoform X2 [Cheilinus undulatus]
MEVDNCVENHLHSCPRDFVKPISFVMDDQGSQPHPRSSDLRPMQRQHHCRRHTDPPVDLPLLSSLTPEQDPEILELLHLGVSTKSKAPSPPGLKKLDSPGFSQWYPGNPHLTMEQKENLIDKELSLVVVLPGGIEKMTTVHGSKPLMDLLVTLCAKYHLNPSSHTLELVTSNRKNTKLKPNALIGTLDAEKILLKPKGEDKNKKTVPQMPEATVRMVINYKKTQKTILRVNPRVPLSDHLPAICEKCEFDVETTVLLRDVHSLAPLDMSHSLNDYAIREVYARDTKAPASPVYPASPTRTVTPGKNKNQKEEENKGLFSMFRRSRKKSYQATTVSAPASPVLVSKPRPLSMALPSSTSSMVGDTPKKRRAPQPPLLVSQSCPSDISTRRRLYSEPNAQLDHDQMLGLSRGSSAESSLKRTKRKAPPPPTSPSAITQEKVSLEENLAGAAASNTLEEIMEQEESTASVKSATASETQGEDGSLNMSADVSLHSPSPDTETLSTTPTEGHGDDQTRDLSSDGNQLQSTVNDAAAVSEERTDDSTDMSEHADSGSTSCQVENASQQPVCEEPTPETVVECSSAPSSPPPPVTQDAEAQASAQANTETLGALTDGVESPTASAALRPAGEDAQVQTDFTPLPDPPAQEVSPSVAGASGKKDMATLTEELDLKPAESITSETMPCQDLPPIKSPSLYTTNSEPKPKPSNELTRDYIPKVGMTTYTIVPQKSVEKLRYFEVALTLEARPAAPDEEADISSLKLQEDAALKAEKEEQSEDLKTSTTAIQDTVNGGIPESIQPSSPSSLQKVDGNISSPCGSASKAGSPTEVKEIKIPPATKPKPSSFRLAQHKKIPGYYVTSAVEKSLTSSPERAKLPPPPSPPPVQRQETTGVQLSPKVEEKTAAFPQITRQTSLSCKEPNSGLSLEKLRSFAAPRPYTPTTPSRFAQAVSSAVKRSQSLIHGQKSPRSPLSSPSFSPVTSPSAVMESKGFSKLKDDESKEPDADKDSSLQGVEEQPQPFSGIVQMEGEGSP